MAKLRDLGHAVGADKPIRLKVYRSTQLPLASEAGAGALIYINDPDDGNPRGTLAVSNGASWDEQALKGEGTSPGGPAYGGAVAARELADLRLRLDASEQAIGTLQGGLRRLEATPIAAPSAPVPVGPDATSGPAKPNSVTELGISASAKPNSDTDLLAALLPIERRLSEVEAALELEVLANLAADALGGDATSAALIADEASVLGITPKDYMDNIAKMRRQRHAAVMQARQKKLRG